jgi:DNA invertase Pin-like site-specific DNA recombinase
LLGHSSCHPDIGYYIDSLGPVLDKDEKWKRAKQRAAKTKKAKKLSKDDLVRIDNMLSNGVSQSKVAQAMGVSQSFVQRNNRQSR